jgi:hypothetical protein
VRGRVATQRVDHPVPLRLLSRQGGQAGFYTSVSGFLPFALSREPVEEISLFEP